MKHCRRVVEVAASEFGEANDRRHGVARKRRQRFGEVIAIRHDRKLDRILRVVREAADNRFGAAEYGHAPIRTRQRALG